MEEDAKSRLGKKEFNDGAAAHYAAQVLTAGTVKGMIETCPAANVVVVVMVPFEEDTVTGVQTSVTLVARDELRHQQLLAVHAITLARATMPLGRRLKCAFSVALGTPLPGLMPDPRGRRGLGLLFFAGMSMLLAGVLLSVSDGFVSPVFKSQVLIGAGMVLVALLRGDKRGDPRLSVTEKDK